MQLGQRVSIAGAIRYLLRGKERNVDFFLSFFRCLSSEPKEEVYPPLKSLSQEEEKRLENLEKSSSL